jgi:polyhydroxyalkanoate synthesis regulator phasin
MRDIIGKMISLELGILSVTRDKVKGIVDDLIRAGEVTQEEGKKLVDEYISRGEKSKQDLRDEVGRMVAESIRREAPVTRAEFEQLKLEVQEIRKELRKESVEHAFSETKGV